MLSDLIFDFVLEQFANEMALRLAPPFNPLPADSWIARSVMQKAIRRSMGELACRAAAQLLLIDRRTLWRRLLVTAMEDLGPDEIDTTARIVAAWRNRKWREQVGGDWPVIAELVLRSAEVPKCQSANDIWNIALHDPALDATKADLCEQEQSDILAVAVTPGGPIDRQAVAVLLALSGNVGCEAPRLLPSRPNDLFDAFDARREFSHVTAVCREAFRLTNVPLAGLTLCLWRSGNDVQSLAKDDWFAPLHWAGDVPTFALDQYTRAGKAAIRRYVGNSVEWSRFCEDASISPALRQAAAGEILFRIDGAAVAQRRTNPLAASLRDRSRLLGAFMPPAQVMQAIHLLCRQLPLIEKLRGASLPPT